ncbi:MAG: hypothetical protein KME23_22090 [Goleter apudmare HA4340-LM2]|jgi:uncharacterized membrane protein|nr:hypothetical protein [Goleter apudmare HA4340-LM2]
MYRINLIGILFLFTAAVMGNVVGRLVASGNVTVITVIAGVMLILIDIIYRLQKPALSQYKR